MLGMSSLLAFRVSAGVDLVGLWVLSAVGVAVGALLLGGELRALGWLLLAICGPALSVAVVASGVLLGLRVARED